MRLSVMARLPSLPANSETSGASATAGKETPRCSARKSPEKP
jgi:hypothetical protein